MHKKISTKLCILNKQNHQKFIVLFVQLCYNKTKYSEFCLTQNIRVLRKFYKVNYSTKNDEMLLWIGKIDEKDTGLFTFCRCKRRSIKWFIAALPVLRDTVGAIQEERSNIIDILWQTYGSIVSQRWKMSWNTWMSLILFFDHNPSSYNIIRKSDAFQY